MKASAFRYNLLSVFAALLFILRTSAGGQTVQTRSSAKSEAQSSRLTYTVGAGGLDSLAYEGQSLLPQTENGLLRVAADPLFRRADGSEYTVPSYTPVRTTLDSSRKTVTLTYAWGAISCRYSGAGDRLNCAISIHNATPDTLTRLSLQVLQPLFPNVPQTSELDAGQFGMGGGLRPLPAYPLTANPRSAPPLCLVDYGSGTLAFCSDDSASSAVVSIPYTTNPPAKTQYPLWVTPGMIAAVAQAHLAVSLRFGASGATANLLAGDVLHSYAKMFPFQVHWEDRRPIGTLFLSSVGPHPAINPRGWFNNDKDVDVTTPQGLLRFREKLLKYADDSVKILKGMNAQGMITWDPEGQEFGQVTYYGDPRLAGRLAPETDYKGAGVANCMDEFFQRFRAAGLRVGVCVRPQEIVFEGSMPRQTDSPDPTVTLKRKIEYAHKRWGCSLFYIDSTVKGEAALDADVFQKVGAAFPDALMIPENETLRYYAYSAPLNSFQHHKVTSTPPGARAVYPRAFSVLLAGEGELNAHRAELVAAVRRGDILLFHGWWPNPNNALIKSIYEEARKP